METANGLFTAHDVHPMRSGRLVRDIKPYVLEDTPDVLIIGGRCVNEGYGFYWPPYSGSPYFELPDFKKHGKRCSLISIHDVPYLVDGRHTRLAADPALPSARSNPP